MHKVSWVSSRLNATHWGALVRLNNRYILSAVIIHSTPVNFISPTFSLILTGQMYICSLSDRIKAVQKLHFSQPLNQHAYVWAVTSTAQWADSFLECSVGWSVSHVLLAIRCLTPRSRVQFPEWETSQNIKWYSSPLTSFWKQRNNSLK